MSEAEPEATLLVVDDEPNIRELLSAALKFAGFDVHVAAGGQEAIAQAMSLRPDLLILDVMMPDIDGFTVLKRLREQGMKTPVLFLTAKDDVADRVQGLTAGGDDYVTKPFSLEEVIARIRAVLRRAQTEQSVRGNLLTFADLEMDDDTHEVRRAGQLVDLSPTEYKLLHFLLVNVQKVMSKQQILDHVWEYDFGGDVGIVESYISYLRKKVDSVQGPQGMLPPLIHTKRGVGYVLRLPPQA